MSRIAGLVVLILLAATRPALAQLPPPPVLLSEGRAYFFGERDRIAAGDILSTSVSPGGRYLLVTHSLSRTETFQSVLAPPDSTETATVALTLFDARGLRITTLWKETGDSTRSAMPVGVSWLSGGETALVHLITSKRVPPAEGAEKFDHTNNDIPREMTLTLLHINAPRQTVRRTLVGDVPGGYWNYGVSPSPARNEALITGAVDDATQKVQFLTGAGTLQPPVTIPGLAITVKGWSADGERAEIRASSMTPEKKRETIWYVWERKTRTLRRAAAPDKEVAYRADEEESDTKRRAALPVRIRGERGTVTAAQTKRDTPCVIAEGKDGKEQFLLATDSRPITILESGDALTAVFESGSALYAAPVYPAPYSAYVTFMRKSMEANVKQIDSAIEQWMMDNKVESLPANFDPIAELIGDTRYIRRDPGLRDPKTGAMAFRNLDTGKPDASGNIPRFSLQTAWGKLTMYQGEKGGMVWDPAELPAKP